MHLASQKAKDLNIIKQMKSANKKLDEQLDKLVFVKDSVKVPTQVIPLKSENNEALQDLDLIPENQGKETKTYSYFRSKR